eukprot:7805457-Pyramimonas_sp.AAC.1
MSHRNCGEQNELLFGSTGGRAAEHRSGAQDSRASTAHPQLYSLTQPDTRMYKKPSLRESKNDGSGH